MGVSFDVLSGNLRLDVRQFTAGIERAVKAAESFVGRLNTTFGRGGDAARKLSDGVTRAAQVAEGALKNVERAAAGIGVAITAAATAGLKIGANFEQSMIKVRVVTGATEADFKKLNAEAQRLGLVTAFSAKDAAAGMEQLGLQGFKTNEILKNSEQVLNFASAAQIDVATAAKTAASAMNAFGVKADELPKILDVLAKAATSGGTSVDDLALAYRGVAPVAHAAGVSIEETTALIQILGKAGLPGERAGSGLKMMFANLAMDAKGAKEVFGELGIAYKNSDGSLRDLADIVDAFNAKIARSGREAEKTGLLLKAFGAEGGVSAAALFDKGGQAIRDFTKNLNDVGFSNRLAQAQLDTLGGSFTVLKSTVQGFGIMLENVAGPQIRKLVQAFNDWAANSENAAKLQDKITVAWKMFSTAVGKVVGVGKELWTGFVPVLEGIWQKIKDVWAAGQEWYKSLSPQSQEIVNVGLTLGAWHVALTKVGSAIPIIGQFVSAIGGIASPLNLAGGAIKLLVPLISGGAGAAVSLGGALMGMVAGGGPIALFIGAAVGIGALVFALTNPDGAMGALKGLGGFLKDELGLAFEAGTSGIKAFVAYLKGDATEAIGHFHETLAKLAEMVGLNGLAKDLHNLSGSELRTSKITEARRNQLSETYGSKAHAETILKADASAQRVQDARVAAKAAFDELENTKTYESSNKTAIASAQAKYDAAKRSQAGIEAEHGQNVAAADAIRRMYEQPGGPSAFQVLEDVRSDKVTDKRELARRLGSGKAAKVFQEHAAASARNNAAGSKLSDLQDELELANDRGETDKAKSLVEQITEARKDYAQSGKDMIRLSSELQNAVDEARGAKKAPAKEEELVDPSKIDWSKSKPVKVEMTDDVAKKAGAAQAEGAANFAKQNPTAQAQAEAAVAQAMAGQQTAAGEQQQPGIDYAAAYGANNASAQATMEAGYAASGGATAPSAGNVRTFAGRIRGQGASAMRSMRESAAPGGISAAEQSDMSMVSSLFSQAAQVAKQAAAATGEEQNQLLEQSKKLLTSAQNAQKAFEGGQRGVEALGKAADMSAEDLKKLDEQEQAKQMNANGQLAPWQQQAAAAAKQMQQQMQQQMQGMVQQAVQQAPQAAADAASAPWAAQGQGMSDLQDAIAKASQAGDPVSAYRLLATFIGAKLGAAKANIALMASQEPFTTGGFGTTGSDNTAYIMSLNTPAAVAVKKFQAMLNAINAKIDALIKGKKHFAAGGVVTSPTDAYIGEAGPEAVIPLWQLAAGMGTGLLGQFGAQGGAISGFASAIQNLLLNHRGASATGPFGAIGNALLNGGGNSIFGGIFSVPNIAKMLSGDNSYLTRMFGLQNGSVGAGQLASLANLNESVADAIDRYRNSRQMYLGPASTSAARSPGGFGLGPFGGPGVSAADPYGGTTMGDMHIHVNGADLTTESQRQAVAESLVGHIDNAIKRRGVDTSGRSALRSPTYAGFGNKLFGVRPRSAV